VEAGDLCEAFARTVARWADDAAMRTSDGSVELTWAEVDVMVRRTAGGLRELGVARGGTTAMVLTNRYEAAVVDLATLHLGAVPLSLYNSSSVAQLGYLVADSRADVVVTETALADRVREALAELAEPPRLVVIDGPGPEPDWAALTGTGVPLNEGERPELSPDDLITVVYTSGTTGEPKGAELTHYNILEQIRGLHSLGRLPEGGRAISYLPFAHMGDRLCAYYMPVVSGATITYHADPRTAVDLLPRVRPSLYMAVPRIWQRVQAGAEKYIAAAPDRAELEEAVELGGRLHDLRVEGAEPDPTLRQGWEAHHERLAALRRAIGVDAGELLFTGAAPLPAETLRFFAAIGTDLCECYGQSETAGIILCNPADRPRPRTNGLPLPGVEAKLAEDGELLLRGPMVMAGYRGKPELTAAAFDDQGWLRSGDVFDTDSAGYYRIVDRKREIIVLSTGKKVSPVLVENTVSAAAPLAGSVVCIGEGRPYVTALIALEPTAAQAVTGDDDPARNATDSRLTDALRDAVGQANESLGAAEQVRRFRVLDRAWQPGTDELTPTMKLKRRPIADKYADEIDSLYGPKCPEVIEIG
jgi:long-subunit acyl-CoA synthetase (AMP-forming)